VHFINLFTGENRGLLSLALKKASVKGRSIQYHAPIILESGGLIL
jgi:hypothetical protein